MTDNQLTPAKNHPLAGAEQIRNPKSLGEFLEANRRAIAEKCASMIDPGKLIQICTNVIAADKTGALQRCTKESFLTALLNCLSYGILPVGGRAYFIPYKTECQYQLGYKGILELAGRCGITANAYAVFEGDEFKWIAGMDETLIHVPNLTADRRPENLIAAYVIATLPDGKKRAEVMTRAEIDLVRDTKSQAASTGKSPWQTDYIEMAKKTVIKRASKYWPFNYELSEALDADDPAPAGAPPYSPAPVSIGADPIRPKATPAEIESGFQIYKSKLDAAKTQAELEDIAAEIRDGYKPIAPQDKLDALTEAYFESQKRIDGRQK